MQNNKNDSLKEEDFMLSILSINAKHRYLRLKEFDKEHSLKIKHYYKKLLDNKKIQHLISEEEFIETAKNLSEKPTLNIKRRGGLGI